MADEEPLYSETKTKNKEPDKWPDTGQNAQYNVEPDDKGENEDDTTCSPNRETLNKELSAETEQSVGKDQTIRTDSRTESKSTGAYSKVKVNITDGNTTPSTSGVDTKKSRSQRDSPKKSDDGAEPSHIRTIRDDSREFESDFDSDSEKELKKSQSLTNLTRYTTTEYADPVYRFYRDVRTGRRRCSAGDLFVAEEAGREVRVLCRCGAGRRLLKRLVRGGSTCERRLIVLHFIINDNPETLMFCRDIPPEHLREALLGAAGGRPCDLVFLRNMAGQLVGISADLETNTPSTAYTVVVVRAENADGGEGSGDADASGAVHQCVRPCVRPPPQILAREHILCLGLLPNFEIETEPLSRRATGGGRILSTRRASEPYHHIVWQRFSNFPGVQLTDDEVASLLTANVDCYEIPDEKILALLLEMFLNFGFLTTFPIQESTLRNFLYEVYKHYNEVPFHNFRHCFCVAQMFYAICMRESNLPLDDLTKLILFVSCICHDLDHPGYNNIYQINARTDLAIRYNDISPLENHHCSVAFRILQYHDCNIFRNFSDEEFRLIREGMIRCILATDMARHNEILAQFLDITPPIIDTNKVNVNLLTMVLIKVADISNEVRPLNIAEPWLDRLLEEFFTQSDLEKRLGLSVTPFMDREKVTKPTSQCAFIGLVLLPLFQALVNHYPELESLLITPARDALSHYTSLSEGMSSSPSQTSNPLPSTSGTQSSRPDSAVAGPSNRDDGLPYSPGRDTQPGSPGSFAQQYCSETEVDVSEKALKFKIATEGSVDKRSYPSSRKGSREVGTSNVDLVRATHYAASPSPPPLEEDENWTPESPAGEPESASSSAAAAEANTPSGEAADQPPTLLRMTRQSVTDLSVTDLAGGRFRDASTQKDMETASEQTPAAAFLPASSAPKSKSGVKTPSPVKSSEKSSSSPSQGSSFQRSILQRLRTFTEKMSFRDSSAPNSPNREPKPRRNENAKEI